MTSRIIYIQSLEYYRSKRAANDVRQYLRERNQSRWERSTGDRSYNLNMYKAIRAVKRTTECEEAPMKIAAILEQYYPSKAVSPLPCELQRSSGDEGTESSAGNTNFCGHTWPFAEPTTKLGTKPEPVFPTPKPRLPPVSVVQLAQHRPPHFVTHL